MNVKLPLELSLSLDLPHLMPTTDPFSTYQFLHELQLKPATTATMWASIIGIKLPRNRDEQGNPFYSTFSFCGRTLFAVLISFLCLHLNHPLYAALGAKGNYLLRLLFKTASCAAQPEEYSRCISMFYGRKSHVTCK